MKEKDIFLSHSSDDKEKYVYPLVNSFDDYGISYWLDEIEIGWGDSIIRKINDGLSKCKFVLVLLTDSFLRKNWTRTELETALSEEISNDKLTVLPLMVTDPEQVFAVFPLLRTKLYLAWNKKTSRISMKISELIGRQFLNEWIGFHPAEFAGQVYIQIFKNKENLQKEHNFSIRWGPWLYEGTLPTDNKQNLSLIHAKGIDGLSVPIFFKIDPPAFVKFGTGSPKTNHNVDINFGWKRNDTS